MMKIQREKKKRPEENVDTAQPNGNSVDNSISLSRLSLRLLAMEQPSALLEPLAPLLSGSVVLLDSFAAEVSPTSVLRPPSTNTTTTTNHQPPTTATYAYNKPSDV